MSPSDSVDDVGLGEVWYEGNPDPFDSSSVSSLILLLACLFPNQPAFCWIRGNSSFSYSFGSSSTRLKFDAGSLLLFFIRMSFDVLVVCFAVAARVFIPLSPLPCPLLSSLLTVNSI